MSSFILALIFCIAGAADIALAIHYFKNKRYFWFGLFTMLTVYMSAFMIGTIVFDIFMI